MKRASQPSCWCLFTRRCTSRRLRSGGRNRHTPKVEPICFVDTLMMLTSVNIKPALLFSRWSEPAIHHAHRVRGRACARVLRGVNALPLSPWSEKLNTLLRVQRPSFIRQHFFPWRSVSGGAGLSLASDLTWARFPAGRARFALCCLFVQLTTERCCGSWCLAAAAKEPRTCGSSMSPLVAGKNFSRSPKMSKEFLNSVCGNLVMFLYPEVKAEPVLHNSP